MNVKGSVYIKTIVKNKTNSLSAVKKRQGDDIHTAEKQVAHDKEQERRRGVLLKKNTTDKGKDEIWSTAGKGDDEFFFVGDTGSVGGNVNAEGIDGNFWDFYTKQVHKQNVRQFMKQSAWQKKRGIYKPLSRNETYKGKKGENADMNFVPNPYNSEMFINHRKAVQSNYCSNPRRYR